MKIFNLTILAVLFIVLSNTDAYSQNCYRQDYGFDNEENDEYVYEDKTYYGYADGGDTIRIKTVLYGRKKYKIYVSTLEGVQVANWRILENVKSTELQKKVVNQRYDYNFKTNDGGEFIDEEGAVLDELGRKTGGDGEFVRNGADLRIVTERIPTYADTVVTRTVINKEEEIYSGQDGSEMVSKTKKIKSVVIEVVFAPGEEGGCYGLFIGSQQTRNKTAHKN